MRFWEPRKCINDKIKSYYASNPLKILAALKFCRIVQYLPLICKWMFQIGMKLKKINHGSLKICFILFLHCYKMSEAWNLMSMWTKTTDQSMKTSCVIILAGGKNCQSRYPPKDSLSLIPGCVQPELFRLYCTMELQVNILQELKLHLQYFSSKAPKVTYWTIVLSQSLWVHTLNIPQCNGMQYGVKTHPVSGHWYLLWIVNCQ